MILHDNYLIEWSKSLNFSKNKKIVLTNFPGEVKDIALLNYLEETNNSLASFQHGVWSEISNMSDEEFSRHEVNNSHYFFGFNNAIKKI